jgi:hypothetical protein
MRFDELLTDLGNDLFHAPALIITPRSTQYTPLANPLLHIEPFLGCQHPLFLSDMLRDFEAGNRIARAVESFTLPSAWLLGVDSNAQ